MRIIKRLFSIIMLIGVFTVICLLPAEGAEKELKTIPVIKDETVYGLLLPDGSIDKIYVVNHIDTPEEGIYTDKGRFSKITNLSNTVKPEVSGDNISFNLKPEEGGFYYQGEMEGELPFKINIEYYFEGNRVEAPDLAGKTGNMKICVTSAENQNISNYEGYMQQMQLSLSLDNCSNISAKGGLKIITGSSITISAVAMPGSGLDFEVSFYGKDFEYDGFTITCLPFNPEGMLNIDMDEITGGINKMSDGLSELISGSKQFKTGLYMLGDGINALNKGISELSYGINSLSAGVSEYTDGAAEIANNAELLKDGLTKAKASGVVLKSGFAELKTGSLTLIESMLDNMNPLQKAAFSEYVEEFKKGIESFEEGLNEYTAGVDMAAEGMQKLDEGLNIFADKGKELSDGVKNLSAGVGKLKSGIGELADKTKGLPSEVEKLISGQQQIKEGFNKAEELINNLIPKKGSERVVSFADGKTQVRSVQFVISSPAVKKPATVKTPDRADSKKENFINRLINLFKK